MLAFILEEDVGYRLSIKTRKARARIWGYWSVRKAERCRPCSGGSVGYVSKVTCAGPGSAMLHCDVVHIWYAKTEWLIFFFLFFFFHWGIRIQIVRGEMSSKADVVLKVGERDIEFQRDFMLRCCWMTAERKRYQCRCRVQERRKDHDIHDKFIMSPSLSYYGSNAYFFSEFQKAHLHPYPHHFLVTEQLKGL